VTSITIWAQTRWQRCTRPAFDDVDRGWWFDRLWPALMIRRNFKVLTVGRTTASGGPYAEPPSGAGVPVWGAECRRK